tara:strand:+ start:17360 stop:18070 length:711 start_codon:yes stop_codon:yes gene_type:complete
MPETQQDQRQFQKRSPAVKLELGDIIKSKFVKDEGENLSFYQTEYGNVSRVNVICSVVDKDSSQISPNIFVDDGTGKVMVRSFDSPQIFDKVEVGDIVTLIGKPRDFNNEPYIAVEILSKLESLDWVKVRKLELSGREKVEVAEVAEKKPEIVKKVEAEVVSESEEVKETEVEEVEGNGGNGVIEIIRELDKGQGVEIQEIIKKQGDESKVKEAVDGLLKKGDVFELKPGVLKVLE